MARQANRPEWIVDGQPAPSIGSLEADEAQPWTDALLFLFDHGEKIGSRRNVVALAPGHLRSCRPATAL